MKLVLALSCAAVLLTPAAAGAKKSKKLVKITKHELVLAKGIHFDSGTARIHDASLPALDAVAQILKHDKKIKLQIAVHTDSRGSSSFNRRISQQRADAIAKYLVDRGVSSKRLDPRGFGEDKPIADNRTAAGRAKNRRIQLIIDSR